MAEKEKEDTIVLSSGAVVRAKRVPDNLILALHRQYSAPKPPIVTIEEEGRRPRREENPNDPDYVQAMETYQVEMAGRITDLIHLTGMEIISLPDTIKDFEEDDEWMEELEAVGINVPLGKSSRRLLWIRYKIAPTSEDLNKISSVYSRTVGGPEEGAVKVMEERFPSET